MRALRSFALCVSAGLAGCGGAAESSLLTPGPGGHDGGSTADVTVMDVQAMDTTGTNDTGPADTGHMMDSKPPPVDTGPPDTGPKLPPVLCGMTTCTAAVEECCVNSQNYPQTHECQSVAMYKSCIADGRTPVFCSEAADCPGQVCCGTKMPYQNSYQYVACSPTCTSTNNSKVVFCNPSASPDVCGPLGKSCNPSGILDGYSVCQ